MRKGTCHAERSEASLLQNEKYNSLVRGALLPPLGLSSGSKTKGGIRMNPHPRPKIIKIKWQGRGSP